MATTTLEVKVPTPVAKPASTNTYTVKKGDTLNAIAQRYGFKNYKEAGITGYKSGNADRIFEGEVLTIGGVPKSTKAVTDKNADAFINSSQDSDMQTVESVDAAPKRKSRTDTALDTFKEVTGQETIFGDMSKPEAPSYMKTYNDLRKQYGVKGLEDELTTLEAEEEDLVARRRQRMTDEQGKPVAMNVISGRMSEVERQEAERLDYLTRQKNTLIKEVQNANATIENIMTFTKLDYETASQSYNTQFSQNLQIFTTIKGMVDSDATDEEQSADNARANLNIIYGAIKDGGLPTTSMNASMKLRIQNLELEAGLPSGFYENIALSNPEGKILSTTTRVSGGAKYADVLSRNSDGSIAVKSVYIGATSEGSGSEGTGEEKEISAFRKDAATYLEKLDTGEISWGAAWNAMKAKYPQASNELIDQMLNKTDNY